MSSRGYWTGGALADRIPAPELLSVVIALGAVGLLAAPFLDDHVLEAVVAWDPGPRANPVIASSSSSACRASCSPE